ncbi:severe depolymerization of actin Sda1p [Cryptosporidium sp. chipmunk genotype I]|uniref:severe depolymerization of actin Sda1p n=1 Tax=Cryptosporidium sp. chipmunk genotype I TaxID=1280935 RepID=UPI00351A266B|nr:severe depolymerization of actin Sda1p [Cryptosporidium sp. chipmunk genotype I]
MDSTAEVYSLPQLQDRIKRDPGAYLSDFELQLQHFYSTLDVFRLNPQNIPKEIFQLMIFIAQTSPYYYKYGVCNKFIEKLLDDLKNNSSLMTSEMRVTMATSLILLSNQKIIDIVYLLPLWFDLMRLPDKILRSKLLKHIVSSIVNANIKKTGKKINAKNRSKIILKSKQIGTSFSISESTFSCFDGAACESLQYQAQKPLKSYNISIGYDLKKFNSTIISFLRERITDPKDILRSLAIIIEVHRQHVWNDAQTVNIIAKCCVGSTSPKVASTAARFLLGRNCTMEELENDIEDEDERRELAAEAAKAMKSALLGVSSNTKKKKMEKAKQAMKKLEKQKKSKAENSLVKSNQCIDLIHCPQEFVEEVFQRVSRHTDPFEIRMTLIGLISRLIERHRLILINYYSYLGRYLSPNNKNVTNILAFLAQACHELIPPQELSSTIKLLMDNFVNECCMPEVIVVGLNTIREICQRVPLVMDKDKLLDLANFRKMNNKGVSIAAKSLVNLYREIMPSMLHRSLMSKEAAINIKDGNNDENILSYGYKKIDKTISGAELLMKYNNRKNKPKQDNESESFPSVKEYESNTDEDSNHDIIDVDNDYIDDTDLREVEELSETDLEEAGSYSEEDFEELVEFDSGSEIENSGSEKLSKSSKDKIGSQNIVFDKILDQEDFKMIKKLKTRVEAAKAVGMSKGQENEQFNFSTASSDEGNGSEMSGNEHSDSESGTESDLNSDYSTDYDISKDIRDEITRNLGKKKLSKQQRVQSIMKGRQDRETFKERRIRGKFLLTFLPQLSLWLKNSLSFLFYFPPNNLVDKLWHAKPASYYIH